MVGNHQGIGLQFRFAAVEQDQRFVLFRHTNHDPALNAAEIEGVHRLTQLQQNEVRYVYHRVDRADAAATQLLTHPQRGWRGDVDTLDYAAQITRTGIGGFNANWQRIADGCCNRGDRRLGKRQLVQHGDVAGHADNP